MALLSDEDEKRTELWRKVFFETDTGKDVLEELLLATHVFESVAVDDEAAASRRNLGIWILFRLGVYQDRNVKEIIDKFATMPYKESIHVNT